MIICKFLKVCVALLAVSIQTCLNITTFLAIPISRFIEFYVSFENFKTSIFAPTRENHYPS